jgi:sugar phosphate isomerase/epimerase
MTAQPDLKWGISTLGCHDLSLEALCALAESREVPALELRSLEGRMDLPAYFDEVFRNPGAVQVVLDRHRQQIISLNSSFKLIDSEEKDRAELLEFARWAEALNVPYIRVFGGIPSMDVPCTEADIKTAVATMGWWQKIREKKGWKTDLAMETHSGFSSGERCRRLAQALSVPLNLIWDTHHTWKLGKESAWETWDQIAPMVRYIQVKDSIPVPSAKHPYTYVLPGAGGFPIQDVFAILKETRYQGIISLEWERQWHPALPPLEQALDALVSNGWKRPISPKK